MDQHLYLKKQKELMDFLKENFFSITLSFILSHHSPMPYEKSVHLVHVETLEHWQIEAGTRSKHTQHVFKCSLGCLHKGTKPLRLKF